MKAFRSFFIFAAMFAVFTGTSPRVSADAEPGQITSSIARVLEQIHYSRHKLDSEYSKRTLMLYLETLDYAHMIFTQQDINTFVAKYGDALNDDILLGNPTPAYEIFDLFKKRAESRVAKVKQWLATEKFTFKSDRSFILNRQKAPWPANEAEADQLWHDRLESDYLALKLAEKQVEPPVKILNRRYDSFLRTLQEQSNRDAVDQFLLALAQAYDPHSEYMSKEEYQNFQSSMALKLTGIGAVLKKSEDGYTKIMELVVGGPAEKEGHLKVGDKVVAVAQGEKDFVEVMDLKLDKVVSMIRGKKGTHVRLQVIPSHAADPSVHKVIEIVRDEVQMKDQRPKAYIIEKPDANGQSHRIGWITILGFNGDSDGSASTTEDVRTLLNRLKKENISALVIDIRRNGGGYLAEATKLTGLFIKRGPVVQVKDANGKIDVLKSEDSEPIYDGPLLILTSTLSASASEIFAGALQDYGRAVIVGDHHSFGKGTVQNLIPVDRVMQFLSGSSTEAGALKLTIQKFYRVAGGSTQFRGVASDVVLPSVWDREDIGESALKNPLPYDEVPPADYQKTPNQPLFLDELRNRSAARVATSPEFKYIQENIARQKEIIDGNKISLNEQKRREEIAKDKTIREKRAAERAKRKVPDLKVYALTLDTLGKPLELAKNEGKKSSTYYVEQWVAPSEKEAKPKKGTKDEAAPAADDPEEDDLDAQDNANAPVIDPTRAETLNIAADLVALRTPPIPSNLANSGSKKN